MANHTSAPAPCSPTLSVEKQAVGLFITFEGTEGSGKSTQIQLLADRLRAHGRSVRLLREPGSTSIGEEIRHTLQHSSQNQAMTPEAELLLISASRAQLVREIIRPALAAGEIVVCDRFLDSTIAYQGYGRGLNLKTINALSEFAVGTTQPQLTLLLFVPIQVSESRRAHRQTHQEPKRDRMEEADQEFFLRVEDGYRGLAQADPHRIAWIDATRGVDEVASAVWKAVVPFVSEKL